MLRGLSGNQHKLDVTHMANDQIIRSGALFHCSGLGVYPESGGINIYKYSVSYFVIVFSWISFILSMDDLLPQGRSLVGQKFSKVLVAAIPLQPRCSFLLLSALPSLCQPLVRLGTIPSAVRSKVTSGLKAWSYNFQSICKVLLNPCRHQ